MQITQVKTKDSSLDYALLTSPEPLQVSPGTGPPSIGVLTFVISCPMSVGSVTVEEIAFNLPVGDPAAPDSTDLTDTATGMSPSVSSSDASQWQIGPGALSGSFLLTPAAGASGVIDIQGLTVMITNIQVSTIVGTSLITIVESLAGDGSAPGICTIYVPKFPYGVVVGNFAASAPQVDNGSMVGLSWIGSVGPTYTMLWGTQSQDVTAVNQWTSPALTDTTTFMLQVNEQQDGQTVTLYYSVTVIVANPNITATMLNVLQGTTLDGATVLAATAPLTANAAVVANAGLAVTGGATVDTLAVTGGATVGGLTVNGSIMLNGTLNIDPVYGIQLGIWSITIDPGTQNLNFNTGGQAMLSLQPDGILSVGSNQVVRYNDNIQILSTGNSTLLYNGEGTALFVPGNGGAYWGWVQMQIQPINTG